MFFLSAAAALPVAFLFGFISSIPPAGPIAALMIHQSARGEHQRALRIGIGAAFVECLFAAFAAGAVLMVSTRQTLLHQLGFGVAALLCPVMGFRLIFLKPSASPSGGARQTGGLGLGATVASLNPAPLIGWGTVVTLLHSENFIVQGALIPLFGLVGGAGVLSWNLLFVTLLKRHLGRLPRGLMTVFVRCVGCVVVAVGLWSALSFVRQALAARVLL